LLFLGEGPLDFLVHRASRNPCAKKLSEIFFDVSY
jgi:hypothetical protein